MIGVNGQWRMSCSLGEIKDFLNGDQLVDFQLVERAGGNLALFEMTFNTENKEVLGYLNEGNVLHVALGRTTDSLMDYALAISKPKIRRNGQSQFSINLSGVGANLTYINQARQGISPPQSGVATLKTIAGRNGLKWDSNVGDSQDKMRWIQPYTSDRTMVQSTWLRTDLGAGDVPLVGITSEGAFRFRSLKTLLAQPPAWTFAYGPGTTDNQKQIMIEGDYQITTSDGLLNQFAGYGLQSQVHNMDTGADRSVQSQVGSLLSTSNKLARSADISPRRMPTGLEGDNVHGNYVGAYINNLNFLCSYSTSRVEINFKKEFYPVRVLDLVVFKDDDLAALRNSKQAGDFYTGNYVVSLVSRRVIDGELVTRVEMVRESPSGLKGNLR